MNRGPVVAAIALVTVTAILMSSGRLRPAVGAVAFVAGALAIVVYLYFFNKKNTSPKLPLPPDLQEEVDKQASAIRDAIEKIQELKCSLPPDMSSGRPTCKAGFAAVPHTDGATSYYCCEPDKDLVDHGLLTNAEKIVISVIAGFYAEEVLERLAKNLAKKMFGDQASRKGSKAIAKAAARTATKTAAKITSRAAKMATLLNAGPVGWVLDIIQLAGLAIDLADPFNLASYKSQDDVRESLSLGVSRLRAMARENELGVVDNNWLPANAHMFIHLEKYKENDNFMQHMQEVDRLSSEIKASKDEEASKLKKQRILELSNGTTLGLERDIFALWEEKVMAKCIVANYVSPALRREMEEKMKIGDAFDARLRNGETLSPAEDKAYDDLLDELANLNIRNFQHFAVLQRQTSAAMLLQAAEEVLNQNNQGKFFEFVSFYEYEIDGTAVDDVDMADIFDRMFFCVLCNERGVRKMRETIDTRINEHGSENPDLLEWYMDNIYYWPIVSNQYYSVGNLVSDSRGQEIRNLSRQTIREQDVITIDAAGNGVLSRKNTFGQMTGYFLGRQTCVGKRNGNEGALIKCTKGTNCRMNIDPATLGVTFNDETGTCMFTERYCNQYNMRFTTDTGFLGGTCIMPPYSRTLGFILGDSVGGKIATYMDKAINSTERLERLLCDKITNVFCDAPFMKNVRVSRIIAGVYKEMGQSSDDVFKNLDEQVQNVVDCFQDSKRGKGNGALCFVATISVPFVTLIMTGRDVFRRIARIFHTNKGVDDVVTEYLANCSVAGNRGSGARIDKEACKAYKTYLKESGGCDPFQFRMVDRSNPNFNDGKDCWCNENAISRNFSDALLYGERQNSLISTTDAVRHFC